LVTNIAMLVPGHTVPVPLPIGFVLNHVGLATE
jgi:hypothetical protein